MFTAIFTIVFNLGFFSILHSLLNCFSCRKIQLFFIDVYVRPESLTLSGNTKYSESIVFVRFALIHGVLRNCNISKIRFSVVKRIVINVVTHKAFWCFHNKPMHQNGRFSFLTTVIFDTHSIIYVLTNATGLPFPLIDKFKVFVVNQCYLPLRKLNLFHISSKEIARFATVQGNKAGEIQKFWRFCTTALFSDYNTMEIVF